MKMKNLIYKWLKPVLLTSILLPFSAIAATSTHLISITPASDFPTEVAVSTTTPLKFTVTNLASTAPLTIVDQSQFPAGSGLSLSSPCNKALYLGQSCTIQVQLQAPATPTVISGFLKEKAQPSLDAVQLPFSITVKNEVTSTTLAVAVGSEGTRSSVNPLFIASKDGGKTWVKSIFPTAANTYLKQINCVGSGDNANCVALTIPAMPPAYALVKNKQVIDKVPTPSVIFSNDSGKTWASSTGLSNITSINNLSCAGQTAQQSVCSLVGYDDSKNPVLLTSSDQGKTWSTPNITGLLKYYSLYHTSCATNAGKVTCIAVGGDGKVSLVFASNEGAQTWTQATIKSENIGKLNNSSCAGKVCTAIGRFKSDYPLWVSTDSGKNWNPIKISSPFELYTTSCGGNDNQVTCIAAGHDYDSGHPVLLVSTDSGNNWNQQRLDTTYGELTASGCSNNANPVCTVTGDSYSSPEALKQSRTNKGQPNITAKDAGDLPLLYVSNNGGKNWQSVTTELTSDVTLSATNCTGSGNNSAVCLAVGGKDGGRLPFLLASSDSGKTWSSTTQGLTTPGQLFDTGGNQINFFFK